MLVLWGWLGCAVPALAQGAAPDEVEIVVESFGVGRTARVGDWVGLRIALKDTADRPRDVLVIVEGYDADGDRPLYQRIVPTDPTGGAGGRWMYFHASPGLRLRVQPLRVSAYEAAEGGVIVDRPRGRRLGHTVANPATLIDAKESLYGIVSSGANATLGLRLYARADADGTPPLAHERTHVIAGLLPRDIPDHWAGLSSFEALFWVEGNPADLTEEAAGAIREWVQRGGHLVIGVPRTASWWENPIGNRLHGLIPPVKMVRREGVALEGLRGLLTERRELALPRNATLYTLEPAGGGEEPGEFVRLIEAPDGACIVAQRSVGLGRVTLVGLDVMDGELAAQGLPEPDIFWHRLLGRRGPMPTDAELDEMKARSSIGFRSAVYLDRELDREIAKSGRAAAGIALGFVVFVAYWLLAGPLGFAVLKRTGHARHAWSAFIASAGLFTALAWGGAMALRPGRIEGSHVTILDAVHGRPMVKARTWASLLIPYYGEARIGVGRPEDGDGLRNVVTAWESEHSAISAGGSFPDLRPYGVDARAPSEMRVPVRSTVKQVRAEWAGEPALGWTFPHPALEGPGARPVAFAPGGGLEGELVHELPGVLRDVIVVVNRGQRAISGRHAFPFEARAYAFDEWAPGVVLSLVSLTSQTGPDTLLENYVRELASARVAGQLEGEVAVDLRTRNRLLAALSLYGMLEPPDYEQDRSGQSRLLIARREAHGLDMSAWLSQPCLIVIGNLGTAGDRVACPTPLAIDGVSRSDRIAGRTVVRWVYPLGGAPPAYRGESPAPVGGAP